MKFCIQDPSYPKSQYLHEALLTECSNGLYGAGAYAFASKEGISLLFEDNVFKKMLENGKFFLIVGSDDITNISSLSALKELEDKYKDHFVAKVYVHNEHGSIFHPKFSWFKKASGGVVIVGSGNLTQGGLRHNREGYGIVDCDEDVFSKVEEEWKNWLAHSEAFLFDVDSEIAKEKAVLNSKKAIAVHEAKGNVLNAEKKQESQKWQELYKQQPKDKIIKSKEDNEETIESESYEKSFSINESDLEDEFGYWVCKNDSEVLIAEIPKSGDRWKQANFDKDSFQHFFGATCGENGDYRILLKNVLPDGTMGETEIRPSVSVASKNYRFELDAASGLDYPDDGKRPIAIFVKVSVRNFLYELVMPDSESYVSVLGVLNEKEQASEKMRRLKYLCSDIIGKTPDLCIWKRFLKDGE